MVKFFKKNLKTVLFVVFVWFTGQAHVPPVKKLPEFKEKTVLATYYHAKTGAYTASGARVNSAKVKNKEHRWIAISRDLRKEFKFGDTVVISSKLHGLNGKWVVRDLMHQRWRNRIDFLLDRLEPKEIKFYMPDSMCIRKL